MTRSLGDLDRVRPVDPETLAAAEARLELVLLGVDVVYFQQHDWRTTCLADDLPDERADDRTTPG
jgi:hypothetical protein